MSLQMINDVLAAHDIATHCPLCGAPVAEAPHTEEHIFPGWLQRRHELLNRKLTIPSLIGKSYKSVKIGICRPCNNDIFGSLEATLAPRFGSESAFAATGPDVLDQDDIAAWLGKILWLLARKSHSVVDHRTVVSESPQPIIPSDLMAGLLYVGVFLRCRATAKSMFSCYLGDPPVPELFYGAPYSLYRFKIDLRDDRFGSFDYLDNAIVAGAALRSGDVGYICLFDGGMHRDALSDRYAYLTEESLHPCQFAEVVGRMFYDQMVLDEQAGRVQYFWKGPLQAVIAQTLTPRLWDPYREANHDAARMLEMLSHYMMQEPAELQDDQGRIFTCLHREDGSFLPFAVTEEESEAQRRETPGLRRLGPIDPAIRIGGRTRSQPSET